MPVAGERRFWYETCRGKIMKKRTQEPPTLAPDCPLIDTHCHLDMDAYADDWRRLSVPRRPVWLRHRHRGDRPGQLTAGSGHCPPVFRRPGHRRHPSAPCRGSRPSAVRRTWPDWPRTRQIRWWATARSALITPETMRRPRRRKRPSRPARAGQGTGPAGDHP